MNCKILTGIFTFMSLIVFGQSDTLTYQNEFNKKVLLKFLDGDSLWLKNQETNSIIVLYLDYDAMEVEGMAFYSGNKKCHGSVHSVTVQFLDENECAIDSECEDFNLGICKEEIKVVQKNNPFGNKGNNSNGGFGVDEDGLNISGSGSGIAVRSKFDDPVQKRFAESEPNLKGIRVSTDTNIHLKLVVNPDGSVKSVENLKRSQNTDTDPVLIDKVIQETKKTLKYNKSNSDQTMTIFVTLRFYR